MLVDLGIYRLCSDSYSLWIEHKSKSMPNWVRCTGYYNNWDGLFKSFVDYSIRHSNAKTAAALIKDINKAQKEAIRAFKGLSAALPDSKSLINSRK